MPTMIAEHLKAAFDKYYDLPVAFWQSVAQSGEVVTIGKETTIKSSNKVENYLYLIVKGCGGILLWNKNNFICTDMVLENDFLCDYLSFITREATPYEVLTFEESTLFRISHAALSEITTNSEYGDKFWRYATQALYIDKHHQYIQAFTSTAAEIYKLILAYQPDLINRIPQKYIASYLGVTPQSLSRIRNDI